MQNQQNMNHVNIELCVVVVLKPIATKWPTSKTSLNAEFIFSMRLIFAIISKDEPNIFVGCSPRIVYTKSD